MRLIVPAIMLLFLRRVLARRRPIALLRMRRLVLLLILLLALTLLLLVLLLMLLLILLILLLTLTLLLILLPMFLLILLLALTLLLIVLLPLLLIPLLRFLLTLLLRLLLALTLLLVALPLLLVLLLVVLTVALFILLLLALAVAEFALLLLLAAFVLLLLALLLFALLLLVSAALLIVAAVVAIMLLIMVVVALVLRALFLRVAALAPIAARTFERARRRRMALPARALVVERAVVVMLAPVIADDEADHRQAELRPVDEHRHAALLIRKFEVAAVDPAAGIAVVGDVAPGVTANATIDDQRIAAGEIDHRRVVVVRAGVQRRLAGRVRLLGLCRTGEQQQRAGRRHQDSFREHRRHRLVANSTPSWARHSEPGLNAGYWARPASRLIVSARITVVKKNEITPCSNASRRSPRSTTWTSET